MFKDRGFKMLCSSLINMSELRLVKTFRMWTALAKPQLAAKVG